MAFRVSVREAAAKTISSTLSPEAASEEAAAEDAVEDAVLLEEPPLSVQMPPWAIRLVLTEPALEKARQETQAAWTDDIDWDELPQL